MFEKVPSVDAASNRFPVALEVSSHKLAPIEVPRAAFAGASDENFRNEIASERLHLEAGVRLEATRSTPKHPEASEFISLVFEANPGKRHTNSRDPFETLIRKLSNAFKTEPLLIDSLPFDF